MLSLLDAPRPAAATGGINWDALTALGTLALAVVTLLTLAYAIWTTKRERRQAASDREDAEKRLEAEREAGDQRLRDERAYEAEMRRRDRQIANVAVLIRRVAEIQASMAAVPGWVIRTETGVRLRPEEMSAADHRTFEAMTSLRHAAWTEAAMLGTSEAAEEAAFRYRMLLILVEEAAGKEQLSDPDEASLKNYAQWVLISLRMLAEKETVPSISAGYAENPADMAEDNVEWFPEPIPPGWWETELPDPPESKSVKRVADQEPGGML